MIVKKTCLLNQSMMPDKRLLDVLRTLHSEKKYKEGAQREEIRIPRFDYQEALKIGNLATRLAKEEFRDIPVAINISLANGHSLLSVGTDVGSALHDDCWNLAKRKTAMRFGCSSYFMRHQLRREQETRRFLELRRYGFHGGALPIFIDSCEFPVACMTVSGLEDYENHWLAVESVRDYIIEINDLAGKYTATDGRIIYCAICMLEVQTNTQSSVIPCNHAFHNKCLGTWIDHNKSRCPVCRSPVPEDIWHQVTSRSRA